MGHPYRLSGSFTVVLLILIILQQVDQGSAQNGTTPAKVTKKLTPKPTPSRVISTASKDGDTTAASSGNAIHSTVFQSVLTATTTLALTLFFHRPQPRIFTHH